ncbi:hypothetical protein LTS07_007622 [Exophiala sideris]|uniref:JmjC domain-containing protein n=1 Tax=Exophiala sideris TaxID=1016849 RepID=A0ABR0JBL9_9EURO|nr:hypothetical protein LTS07_007622 [Exophiala sideris]KAK5032352.1 hypothetical protein LTR13_007175 [Exophiala sideris]KAK5059507.1 hypothetical protein LTR69_006096 [Exophiala sideris]KAK5186670.1 hypothetical protein LTR44_000676 [Eurotiomycetes sp. CCFEE 6388]
MIPQTPSVTVPADSSARQLLRLGKPFVEFPRFSILDLLNEKDHEGSPVPFSEWLTKRLQLGQPFVIADFEKLDTWPAPSSHDGHQPGFGIERLIELSTKKNIPIRNCSTGRDLSFTLKKFADSARQSFPEFQNLYARDLQCPQEWLEQCRKILPTEVQWGGRLDLFQWLPQCARSEVMMAYVGSEGSSSGFHRCFSSTVALNLLVESDDRPVVCIGTDFASQKKYDSFMSARGVSPHLDWLNLGTDEIMTADFPLYAYDQRVGDLVIFPPATAHQIWNPSTLSAKLVWNILHPLSLEVGFQYVQAPFNRLCHPDVARTNLSLACAMLSLLQDNQRVTTSLPLPPDLPLLSRLFKQMVHDESVESRLVTEITLVPIQHGTIATCNFCSTAIWNRHVRCTVCADFDLCLLCYLNGRSCEHSQSYAWAELVPPEQCTRVLNRAREILGFQPEEPPVPDRCKTLGTAVNDLMRARLSGSTKLCHLCRIDHQEWKGRRCDKCSAFFCYRGLFRHFDQHPADVLRHKGIWVCPKCGESCNCRCCHFVTAYVKSEKPASKRRVKAGDARGKVMGFADNVFDQKRNRRESNSNAAGNLPGVAQITGKKRTISSSGEPGPATPLRKIELPTPEPDFSTHSRLLSREGSDLVMDAFGTVNGNLPTLLPSMKTFPDGPDFMVSPSEERNSRVSSSPGIASLASTGIGGGRIGQNITLPPILGHTTQNGVFIPQHNSSGMLSTPSTAHTTSPTKADVLVATANKIPTAALDASIVELETQLRNLKKYEEEFIALNLEDSRKMLATQVAELEIQIKTKRREKSLLLIERLKREGFGGLAASVGKEVGLGIDAALNGSA